MPLFSQNNNLSSFRFFSLGSGSSGNCYFLGNREYGILIDAGIGIRTINKALTEYGTSLSRIRAVLVTHDHADHIKTVGCLGTKYNIPVYATQRVHQGIERSRYTPVKIGNHSKKIIELEQAFVIEDFSITSFEVPHDSIENTGFHLDFKGQQFLLVTDVGRITPTIEKYARNANHIVFEANYDDDMLRNGAYPKYLKERICSGMGHISNKLSAQFLAEIYSDRLKNIWLCHLSKDNNTPQLAFSTIASHLESVGAKIGVNLKLETLSRHKTSGLREL